MLLGKLKRFDILFLGFSFSILLVLLSAFTQSLSIFWHDSRAWKFATELGQLVGGLATFGTLIWLVLDRFRDLKKSNIESVKNKFISKVGQTFDLTETTVFEPYDSFVENALDVRKLLSQVSDCGDKEVEAECRKALFSAVKRQLNHADMLILLSVITNGKVQGSKENFDSTYSVVKECISNDPVFKVIDEDLQPHLINILTILEIARHAGYEMLACFCLGIIRDVFVQALKDSSKDIAQAINTALNADVGSGLVYEIHFASIFRVFRTPALSGIFLATSQHFLRLKINPNTNTPS